MYGTDDGLSANTRFRPDFFPPQDAMLLRSSPRRLIHICTREKVCFSGGGRVVPRCWRSRYPAVESAADR